MASKNRTPVAIEKQREFGAILKGIRLKAGLSKARMGKMLGTVSSAVSSYEWETCPSAYSPGALISKDQLSVYLELADNIGFDQTQVLRAYFEADNERRPWLLEKENPYSIDIRPPQEVNLISIAKTEPKFFLERVRWNPVRIQATMERLAFWQEHKDYPQISVHCKVLGHEAKRMLEEYRKTEAIFFKYAHDLPGYEMTKKVYFEGVALSAVLEMNSCCYTYRWAQELLRRTLATFQRRLLRRYDQ